MTEWMSLVGSGKALDQILALRELEYKARALLDALYALGTGEWATGQVVYGVLRGLPEDDGISGHDDLAAALAALADAVGWEKPA